MRSNCDIPEDDTDLCTKILWHRGSFNLQDKSPFSNNGSRKAGSNENSREDPSESSLLAVSKLAISNPKRKTSYDDSKSKADYDTSHSIRQRLGLAIASHTDNPVTPHFNRPF